MYYPQQSPGITHKLTSHHDQSAWGRAAAANQSILVPPGSQPVGVGMTPLQSQGYQLYTNGALQHHHPGHHHLTHAQLHHQNTLSHYPSPPNGHAHQQQQQQQQQQPHMLAQGSPVTQMISPHWQQQLLKCDVCLVYATRPKWLCSAARIVNANWDLADDSVIAFPSPPCAG